MYEQHQSPRREDATCRAIAPKLITQKDLTRLKKGTVLVDIAIDQGGCFETSTVTTHQARIFMLHGIVHYCVANMPGGAINVELCLEHRNIANRLG